MKRLSLFFVSASFCLTACSDDGAATDAPETGDGDGDGDTTGDGDGDATGDGDGDGDATGDGDGDATGDGDGDVITDGPEPVELGTAADYAILAKSGISTTGVTLITGDIGLSPADSTYITGFDLSAPPTAYTLSDLVTGMVYASDYDAPTPSNLTTAVADMETAYTDAAGRTLPDYTELGAGNIDGLTLTPGLYKWGTGVQIPTGVTLSGSADGVWIFQVGEDLILGNAAMIQLEGGATPDNVFWQVAGQATLGTTSTFQGVLLSQTLIEFNTGSVMNGQALAQAAVTLDATVITAP